MADGNQRVTDPRRAPAWLAALASPRAAQVALAIGVVLAVAPLATTRVLPFHDSAGIVGLGGALALRDDPAAGIARFYDIDIRAYPSALYFGWALGAGALGLSVELAFSLFIALFCLAGPPLAMWWLLRAFRRPPALALLVFPVSYHHQIWYGFLGSSAAITGFVLALAFARRIHDRPGLGNHLGLAGALAFVAAAHPFPLALTLAAVAPLLLWPPARAQAPARGRRALAIAARLATLLPTGLFLGNWAAGFFNRPVGDRSLFRTLRATLELELEAPALADAGLYLDWLGNGYKAAADALVPALGLVTLLAFLLLGVRAGESAPATSPQGRRRDVVALGWAAGVLLLGFLFLPMKLVWPELWWGVRVRCVLPSYLVLIALVRVRTPAVGRGRLPALPVWALAPAYGAALAFFAFVFVDFAGHFRGRALAGFDEVIATIPAGQSVLGFPLRPEPHYTLAHPYIVQHHVARRGGRAVPHLRGHPGSYWITMKPPPDSPPWGDARAFEWERHGDWDWFLVERPPADADPATVAESSAAVHPMSVAPPGAVRLVKQAGRFEAWQRTR